MKQICRFILGLMVVVFLDCHVGYAIEYVNGVKQPPSRYIVPTVEFDDIDCTDPGPHGQIYGNATDTGSGSEDFDKYLQQMIAGSMTTWLFANADGNVEIGSATQPTEALGGLIVASGEKISGVHSCYGDG